VISSNKYFLQFYVFYQFGSVCVNSLLFFVHPHSMLLIKPFCFILQISCIRLMPISPLSPACYHQYHHFHRLVFTSMHYHMYHFTAVNLFFSEVCWIWEVVYTSQPFYYSNIYLDDLCSDWEVAASLTFRITSQVHCIGRQQEK